MNYLVIGAGGTGGCLGGALARSGQDVTFIARGGHLAAMERRGLQISSARLGDFTLDPVEACTMENYRGRPDVIFVCVKYYALEETAAFLRRTAGPDTLVIPILNVFGTGQVLQEQVPRAAVLDGCIYIYSMIGEPGVILQPTEIFKVFFGFRPGQDRRLEARALQVQEDLRRAGVDAWCTPHIQREALKKFSFVSPMGAAGLYCNAAGGAFLEPGPEQDLFLALVREIGRLGGAMGITFDVDLVQAALDILRGLTRDSTTSMQRDVARGGPSEIDGLVHRVVRLGEACHVDLPAYRTVSQWAREHRIP